MAKRYDIDLNPTAITAYNDLPVYESDIDHIEDTIASPKGAYKEFPNDGVQIDSYLNSSGQETTIQREIILQLKSDNYRSQNPVISYDANGELQIQPNAVLDL